jgi:hypothetical protein
MHFYAQRDQIKTGEASASPAKSLSKNFSNTLLSCGSIKHLNGGELDQVGEL